MREKGAIILDDGGDVEHLLRADVNLLHRLAHRIEELLPRRGLDIDVRRVLACLLQLHGGFVRHLGKHAETADQLLDALQLPGRVSVDALHSGRNLFDCCGQLFSGSGS